MENYYSKISKAACLILADNITSKLLFIQRPSTVAFPNQFAFPGGQLDQEDITLTKLLFGQIETDYVSRITALRETFEEVGILINQSKDYKDFSHFIIQQQPENILKIQPALRIITGSYQPKRYDTSIFIHIIDDKTFNYNKYRQNQDPFNLNLVNYDKKEVVQYKWLTPQECLKKFYKNEIEIARTQIILLNFLCQFETIQQAVDYLKNCRSLLPYQMIQMKNTFNQNYPIISYNLMDYEYPIQKLLDNEQDQSYIEELKYYQKVSLDSSMRNRFYFKSEKFFLQQYDLDIQLPFQSPFQKLVNYQKLIKQINLDS